jgi:hypothetical protein
LARAYHGSTVLKIHLDAFRFDNVDTDQHIAGEIINDMKFFGNLAKQLFSVLGSRQKNAENDVLVRVMDLITKAANLNGVRQCDDGSERYLSIQDLTINTVKCCALPGSGFWFEGSGEQVQGSRFEGREFLN